MMSGISYFGKDSGKQKIAEGRSKTVRPALRPALLRKEYLQQIIQKAFPHKRGCDVAIITLYETPSLSFVELTLDGSDRQAGPSHKGLGRKTCRKAKCIHHEFKYPIIPRNFMLLHNQGC